MSNCGTCDSLGRDACAIHRPGLSAGTMPAHEFAKMVLDAKHDADLVSFALWVTGGAMTGNDVRRELEKWRERP